MQGKWFGGRRDTSVVAQRCEVRDIILPSKMCEIVAAVRTLPASAEGGFGFGDLLEKPQCLFSVAPDNLVALARTIATLADASVERARMGNSGRNLHDCPADLVPNFG